MAILATVTMPYTTGLPEDIAVNTFAFDGDPGDAGAESDLTDLLEAFYTTVVGSFSIGSMISEVVSRTTNACRIDLAEIVDTGPTVDVGPVYFSADFTMTAPHGTGTAVSLPLEVAIVNSVRNVLGTGPVARRRGRQYIGPLDIIVLSTTGPFPLVDPTFTSLLATQSEALATDSATNGTSWCVWSRTAGQLFLIEAGFVDNEFDTQRRRGADATLRESWSTLV